MLGIKIPTQSSSLSFDAVYCPHAEIAHDWLSIFYDVYGFGLHLPSPESSQVIEYMVKRIVADRKRISKYRLNLEFSREVEIFSPLFRLLKSQISPE